VAECGAGGRCPLVQAFAGWPAAAESERL